MRRPFGVEMGATRFPASSCSARVPAESVELPAELAPLYAGAPFVDEIIAMDGRPRGLRALLAEARRLGGVDDDVALEVYPPEPTLLDFVNSLGDSSLPLAMMQAVTGIAEEIGVAEARGVGDTLKQLLLLTRRFVWSPCHRPTHLINRMRHTESLYYHHLSLHVLLLKLVLPVSGQNMLA